MLRQTILAVAIFGVGSPALAGCEDEACHTGECHAEVDSGTPPDAGPAESDDAGPGEGDAGP